MTSRSQTRFSCSLILRTNYTEANPIICLRQLLPSALILGDRELFIRSRAENREPSRIRFVNFFVRARKTGSGTLFVK